MFHSVSRFVIVVLISVLTKTLIHETHTLDGPSLSEETFEQQWAARRKEGDSSPLSSPLPSPSPLKPRSTSDLSAGSISVEMPPQLLEKVASGDSDYSAAAAYPSSLIDDMTGSGSVPSRFPPLFSFYTYCCT